MTNKLQNHASIHIVKATLSDLDTLEKIMLDAQKETSSSGYFCADDRSYLKEHILNPDNGFILKAVCNDSLAGFLVIHYPHLTDENLGYDCFTDIDLIHRFRLSEDILHDSVLLHTELEKVAHFDSSVVSPDYRGCHIMGSLMAKAMDVLSTTPFCYYCATVHPDNQNSLKNLLALDFKIIKTTVKYGGLPRNIMLYHKDID